MSIRKKSELEQLITDVHGHHINYHNREIYLHSSYSTGWDDGGGEAGVEYRMATTFVKNLHILLNQASTGILVHMHSIGGEWNDGMAVFNAIRFAAAPITIIAYSQASSMTGVMLQCADRRLMVPDCEFMIHHGSIGISATSPAAKSAIDVNERYCKRMLQIFARRAVKSGKFFKEKKYTEEKAITFIDKKLKDKIKSFLLKIKNDKLKIAL
jgi:ATP-dependent protease ClpP protease subunit